MPNRLADYWDEQFSTSKMNCTHYFEQYLLAASASPLVLCLDEVERVFDYRDVASDFLGLLRAWHEQARTRNIWRKLRLVVVHPTFRRLLIESEVFFSTLESFFLKRRSQKTFPVCY